MRGALRKALQWRGTLQLFCSAPESTKALASGCVALQHLTLIATPRGEPWLQVALLHADRILQPQLRLRHQGQQQRHFSNEMHSSSSASELPEGAYHKLVDQTLDDLVERLECFIEDIDLSEGDVEYSQGVVTVRLGKLGTYVINKQTPNRQIWMSSPISGPVRYDWGPGRWVYHRDGHDLHTRLSSELKQLTGEELDLSGCFACGQLNSCSGDTSGDDMKPS